MIAVKLDNDSFNGALLPIVRSVQNPRPIMMAVGREGANRLKKHFLGKEQGQPNKLGGPREHFWRKVAQSVNAPVLDASGLTVSIAITHVAFAQKLFGGTITAKRAGALTIPQQPEAYGRSAAVFEQETGLKLFVLKFGGKAFLAAATADGSVKIEYLLTPSVNQDPDPTALPDMEEFKAALLAKAQEVANRQASGEAVV